MTSTARKNTKPSPKTKAPLLEAPILWKLLPPRKIRVHSELQLVGEHLWLCDTQNVVHRVSLDGQVVQSWQLPDLIEELIVDGNKVHARNRKGMLFDLSGKQPRPFQQHGQLSPLPRVILHRGRQVVLGKKGVVSAYDKKGNELWSNAVKGTTNGWLFCADDDGIYLNAGGSVLALDWEGELRWETKISKKAMWRSWQSRHRLYASVISEGIFVLDKPGELVAQCRFGGGFCSAVTSEDESRFFVTGGGRVVCWSGAGERLWEIRYTSDLTSATCIHGDRVYIASFRFGLVCIDISPKALAAAAKNKLPSATTRHLPAPAKTVEDTAPKATTKTIAKAAMKTTPKAPKAAPKATTKATVKAAPKAAAKATSKAKTARPGAPQKKRAAGASAAAVTIECVQEGKEIRARVVSKGYHRDWACQFPRALRIAGARYQVDGVVESTGGSFYRVVGGVRRLP